jgi:hypothetical protein
VQNWEDARYGIQEMFIEESYGFGIINEGQSIGRSAARSSFNMVAKALINHGFRPCRASCHHLKTVPYYLIDDD